MLFVVGLAVALGSFLALSRTTLKTAHRTYFANDALNLAEAGLEEAMYSFGLMAGGTAAATAWTGWSITGANATRTLSPFNRDQRAVGVVKVYVKGATGLDSSPYIMSQARITPFDGSAPIVRTVLLRLSKVSGTAAHTLVGLNGVTLTGGAYADSFNSNPLGTLLGPWDGYSTLLRAPNASVVALNGTVDIASGYIWGDLYLGSGVTSPSPSRVSGNIYTNYTATFPFPTYPTPASVTQSYDLGTTMPAALPRLFDVAASDGRFYYFIRNTTISTFAVGLLSNVSIIGTNTGMAGGVTLPITSSLHVYMDKPLVVTAGAVLNILGWPGSLRIYTTSASASSMANGCQITAWFQSPNGDFVANGTSPLNVLTGFYLAKTITASGTMNFHYDLTLQTSAITLSYNPTQWYELRSPADRAAIPGMTGSFLQ